MIKKKLGHQTAAQSHWAKVQRERLGGFHVTSLETSLPATVLLQPRRVGRPDNSFDGSGHQSAGVWSAECVGHHSTCINTIVMCSRG